MAAAGGLWRCLLTAILASLLTSSCISPKLPSYCADGETPYCKKQDRALKTAARQAIRLGLNTEGYEANVKGFQTGLVVTVLSFG